MAKEFFKVGTVVQLNSSRFPMTVSETFANDTVQVFWFDGNSGLHEATFPVRTLRPYKECD